MVMKYSIGDVVVIKKGIKIFGDIDSGIPRDRIVHGDIAKDGTKGVIQHIYKEYYLIKSYQTNTILGYEEDNLELISVAIPQYLTFN